MYILRIVLALSLSHISLLACTYFRILCPSLGIVQGVKDRYPDCRDRLINNVKARVGLGPDNEPIADEAAKLGPLASLDSHAAVCGG
jgi:hypothetical protein